jgi:hypothetical protein
VKKEYQKMVTTVEILVHFTKDLVGVQEVLKVDLLESVVLWALAAVVDQNLY